MLKPRTILDYFSNTTDGQCDKSRVPHRRPPIKFRTLDDFQFPASLDVVDKPRPDVPSPIPRPDVLKRTGLSSLPTIDEDVIAHPRHPPPQPQRITCYTDGSCVNNGSANARGAYAVYFPNAEFPNIAEKFINKPTNQRCELMAIFKAIRIFADYYKSSDTGDIKKAILYTDSEYSLKCIQQYCKKWSHNGWLKADRKPIENRDIIQPLYELYSQPHVWKNVELRHIRSHTGLSDIHSQSNEVVDRMAKAALGGGVKS